MSRNNRGHVMFTILKIPDLFDEIGGELEETIFDMRVD